MKSDSYVCPKLLLPLIVPTSESARKDSDYYSFGKTNELIFYFFMADFVFKSIKLPFTLHFFNKKVAYIKKFWYLCPDKITINKSLITNN